MNSEKGQSTRGPYVHERYLASVDNIEGLTGVDLLTGVSERGQREMERVRRERVWSEREEYFAEGCRRSRSYVVADWNVRLSSIRIFGSCIKC